MTTPCPSHPPRPMPSQGIVITVFIAILFLISPGEAWAQAETDNSEARTVNREVSGWTLDRPRDLRPLYQETFQPQYWDQKTSHAAEWMVSQDWNPKGWNPRQWTEEKAVRKFFENHVLRRQYSDKGILVVEVGPNFYTLSEQDRHRVMKLLADEFEIFRHGHHMFEVRDWRTNRAIGYFTPRGLMMN